MIEWIREIHVIETEKTVSFLIYRRIYHRLTTIALSDDLVPLTLAK